MVFSSLYDKKKRDGGKIEESKTTSAAHTSRKKRKKKRSGNTNDTNNNDKSKDITNNRAETLSKDHNFDHPRKKPKKGPPSSEALELSERLRTFSRNKNLTAALQLYRDKSNDSIRDSYHAGIIVDCCAKCGNISEGEKIVEEMEGCLPVTVEIKTALLKGYSLSGMILKAEELFDSMCKGATRRELPNTRSLNTLLRGCLWSAARPSEKGTTMVGGVVTAERAWTMCKALQNQGRVQSIFDVSSYEYSIIILCQAMKTTDSVARINEMKKLFLPDDDINNIDQSVSESLAISYLALARAHCILNEKDKVVDACDSSQKFLTISQDSLARGQQSSRTRGGGADGPSNERREESNVIFRKHRLNEVNREARALKEIFKDSDNKSLDNRQIGRRLMTRLIVLSGGGTTPDSSSLLEKQQPKSDVTTSDNDDLLTQIVNTAYFGYGFDVLTKRLNIAMREGVEVLKRRDCNRLLGCIGLQGGVVQSDGTIDFPRIFSAGIGERKRRKGRKNNKSRRMEIELGSGFGDWIVQKAIENPNTNFLSVELRSDRVGQTFARTAALAAGAAPVDNLCIVGAESCSFLSKHVKPGSVSTIYINHPEPPTQTIGIDDETIKSISNGGDEPSHMLNSTMIIAAGKCLSESSTSRIVIVTDNRWYGRLICATMVKVCHLYHGLFSPVDVSTEDGSFDQIETFTTTVVGGQSSSIPTSKISVALFQGQPNATIGHPKGKTASCENMGSSYFDRLWRSGAGQHAEKNIRFIIVLARK